jgi:hypothetical protein
MLDVEYQDKQQKYGDFLSYDIKIAENIYQIYHH